MEKGVRNCMHIVNVKTNDFKKGIVNVETNDISINTESNFELDQLKEETLKKNQEITNLKNDNEKIKKELQEEILNLKNNIDKISKKLEEKNRLLEENNKEILKLKESDSKTVLVNKGTQTENIVNNNISMLIPMGLICFGLVTKFIFY